MTPIVHCPECTKSDWEEYEPSCEDCGNHSGYRCKHCDFVVDHVWQADLYDKISDMLESKYIL